MSIHEAEELGTRARIRAPLPSPAECRILRQEAGITQRAVADAVGVAPATVSMWELGARTPTGGPREAYAALIHKLRERFLERLENEG